MSLIVVVFQLRSACRESYSRITRGSMLRSRDELNNTLQIIWENPIEKILLQGEIYMEKTFDPHAILVVVHAL